MQTLFFRVKLPLTSKFISLAKILLASFFKYFVKMAKKILRVLAMPF